MQNVRLNRCKHGSTHGCHQCRCIPKEGHAGYAPVHNGLTLVDHEFYHIEKHLWQAKVLIMGRVGEGLSGLKERFLVSTVPGLGCTWWISPPQPAALHCNPNVLGVRRER